MVGALKETSLTPEKTILISCELPQYSDQESDFMLDELKDLVKSTGALVLDTVVQKRKEIDRRYYLGRGKVEELKGLIKKTGATTVVADDELTSLQLRNLEEALQVKILDRSQIILDLFAHRAHSKEGKIQVELAQLEYLLPRLVGGRKWLSRLGGGIGTRGPGETKLELDQRMMRKRIRRLKKDLEDVRKEREILRRSRRQGSFFVISLLGYTNAGKSTLFKTLTGMSTEISPRLFSTLDPKIRLMRGTRNILLSDTVGLIRKIPHHLFASFRATLEEAQEANLILLVVDGSNPQAQEHLQVARQVIESLGLYNKPILTAVNKIDLTGKNPFVDLLLRANQPAVAISALSGENLDELVDTIKRFQDSYLYAPVSEHN